MITQESTKILPCPFCGSEEVAHFIVPQYERPGLPPDTWVVCKSCKVEVRESNGFQALALWNTRP